MNIYLIRHGEAEKSSITKKDFDRELTNSGKVKVKNAALAWKDYIDPFDYLVSSPLARALQTAKIIAEYFEVRNEILVDKKLSAGGGTESIIEIANSLEGVNIAFVGHQPDFSEHVSNLISTSGANVDFKKAAIAKIFFHNKVHLSRGILEYLIPAGIFNK
ncbi:MAG: SixA phosphatase family protein [Ignavibacteriaceae bacterium]